MSHVRRDINLKNIAYLHYTVAHCAEVAPTDSTGLSRIYPSSSRNMDDFETTFGSSFGDLVSQFVS